MGTSAKGNNYAVPVTQPARSFLGNQHVRQLVGGQFRDG
jgi:hypothetical protein